MSKRNWERFRDSLGEDDRSYYLSSHKREGRSEEQVWTWAAGDYFLGHYPVTDENPPIAFLKDRATILLRENASLRLLSFYYSSWASTKERLLELERDLIILNK